MVSHTSTRRGILGAMAFAPVVIAVPALAHKPQASASPELLRLIAAADRAEADASAYGRDVYDPARNRWFAADEATPHVEVVGFAGAAWSTKDAKRVANARMWTSKPRQMSNPGAHEEYAAMQRLVAAHDERRARVDREGNRARYDQVHDQDEQNGAHAAEAMDCVAAFQPASLTDLRVKLAYMVKHDMGTGMDWLPELLADVTRLAA